MVTQQQLDSFWNWASGPTDSQIQALPESDDSGGSILPSAGEIADAVSEALDPFGLLHSASSMTSLDSGAQGAISGALSQFGKSFGQIAGLAILAGVGYLIFKSERAA